MRDQFNERYLKAARKVGICIAACGEDVSELSKADTFIEYCFEKACAYMKRGKDVLTEWYYHKEQYCKITDTIIYDFGHYSRHDASHSVSILETMEMLIGDARLVMLSRGDLWLLLEGAYSHDIGMALTGEELCNIWQTEEFKDYLRDCLNSKRTDMKQAALYYYSMNDALMNEELLKKYGHDKERSIFDDYWPANIANYVKWLVSDYIRKRHSIRNMVVRKRIVTLTNSEVPSRLYRIVTTMAEVHTVNEYRELFRQLEYEEKGIGAELIHPRFAAAMLRVGDVLDVENNRFYYYSVEHMMRMPIESAVHLMKHEAVRHIVITTERVQLEAVSDKIEVCKCVREWFNLVEVEVRNLIYSWNEIAPSLLQGCTLKSSECHVYFQKGNNEYAEYSIKSQKYFEVNKHKLIELLVGANIYSLRLDFVREYLQNAMDASKMQMWKDIVKGTYEDVIDMQLIKDNQLTPFDIPKEVYDRYEVKLKVRAIDGDYENMLLTVEDHGIGIEEEGISVISNVGTGWRGRERYTQMIEQMPHWVRPTGGFGIGIQSAFMVTSEVVVETQTDGEIIGRRITLTEPKTGGEIEIEECNLGRRGTRVQIKVPIKHFLEWNGQVKQEIIDKSDNRIVKFGLAGGNVNGFKGKELFEVDFIEDHTKEVLEQYLTQIIPETFFPVRVSVEGFHAFHSKRSQFENNIEKHEMRDWNGMKYILLELDRYHARIWDCKEGVLVDINAKSNMISNINGNSVCYKSIRMTGVSALDFVLAKKIDMHIDFMGLEAKEVLKIHRNEFIETFQIEEYRTKYLQLYFHLVLNDIVNIAEMEKEIEDNKREELAKGKQEGQFKIANTGVYPARDILLIQMLYTKEEDKEKFRSWLKLLDQYDSKEYKLKGKKIDIGNKGQTGSEDGIQNDKKETFSENSLKLQEKEWGLLEFYDKLNAFWGHEEGHKILLAQDQVDLHTVGYRNISTYLYTKTKTWIAQNIDYINGKKEYQGKKDDVYYALYCDGVIYDNFLCELLDVADMEKWEKNTVAISENSDENMIFWELLDKVANEKKMYTLREFYERSWDETKGDFIVDFPEEYTFLAVKELPYTGEHDIRVIRPVSSVWIKEFHQNSNNRKMDGKKIITKDEFIQKVMGTDMYHPTKYFGYLMQWVSDHAVEEKTRNDKQVIWEGYRSYVGGIYDEKIKYEDV